MSFAPATPVLPFLKETNLAPATPVLVFHKETGLVSPTTVLVYQTENYQCILIAELKYTNREKSKRTFWTNLPSTTSDN